MKSKYLCSMQVDSNWYWDHHAKRYVITIPTCTILHPRLKVNVITDIQDIPKNVCNRTQEKTSISRHRIFLTDSYYGYSLEAIGRQDNIGFERGVEIYSDDKKLL